MSLSAALLHVLIVLRGAAWYRFFGAGEQLASAAEAGRIYPALITLGIAAVLALWAAYALSGAGFLLPLPWLKWVLAAITSIYIIRGLGVFPMWLFARAQVTPFVWWSSLICTGFGVAHLVGLLQVWAQL